MIFEGTLHEYRQYLKNPIFKYQSIFEHAWEAENIKTRLESRDVRLSLGDFKIVHAGEEMNSKDYPLKFVDGSVLMIAQTLRALGNRKLELIQSTIVFVKVVEGRAQYVFHYDKVVDIPNHPDNHLQIEFDKNVNTPRFDTYKFVELEEIIGMIIRDGLIMT